MDIRGQIESGFERWGHLIAHRKWETIVLILLLSAFAISQLGQLRFETSIEKFLLEDDPTLLTYEAFRDQFERDDRIVIGIRPPRVFSLEFLAKLRALHRDLENEVPTLEEVTSLINARSTRGEGDDLIVEDLLEDWPRDEQQVEALRRRVLANPLYRNLLVSEDGRYTTVNIELDAFVSSADGSELEGFGDEPVEEAAPRDREFLTGEHDIAAMKAVRAVLTRYEGSDFEVFMAGSPVMTERITEGMTRDMSRFLLLAFVASAVFLFVLFRRVSGTLLPLVVVVLSLLSTLGLTPLLGIPIQVPTQILPSFLLAVGIGDSVHILAIFYRRLAEGRSREDAIADALAHAGLAVVMTSLTTAGALLSFAATDLRPIAHLGVIAPIGVLLALLYTLTLLPALLVLAPQGRSGAARKLGLARIDCILARCASLATSRPRTVVAASGLVILVALSGVLQLRFGHDPIGWFPRGDALRVSTEKLNETLKGVMTVELLFDTHAENGMHDPALLQRLEELEAYNATIQDGDVFIGKTLSLVNILREIHQALNENRPEFYAIPKDRQLVAQELLLFENSGSDDLEDFVDSRFSVGRMTLRVPWTDAIAYPPLLRELGAYYRRVIPPNTDVTVTGLLPLLSRTFEAVIHSMARSYVIAFVIITGLMILLLGSLRLGLISMIPNLAPILLTLAVMGWFHLPLDGFTLLIGSVAIGLAVDDTIHFMHGFRRVQLRTGDPALAVRETLATTGQALFVTSLVLCTGFFIFMAGTMRSTFNFGFLTGLALALAFLADVLLAPALMMLVTRDRRPC
ncbi:MAG: RND family transporter [Myxococcota bacterium]